MTDHFRMTSSWIAGRRATVAVSLAVGLAVGSLAALPGNPAHAAQSTTAVLFTCDLLDDNLGPVPGRQDVPVAMNVDLAIPTLHDAQSAMVIGVDGLVLPADLIPEDLTSVAIGAGIHLDRHNVTEHPSAFPVTWIEDGYVGYPGFDRSQPQPLVAFQATTSFSMGPGIYGHQITDFRAQITGAQSSGSGVFFTLECDELTNPPIAVTTTVYDIQAAPIMADVSPLDVGLYVYQGQTITVSGHNMLTQPPTVPPASTDIYLETLLLGSLPLDEAGSFSGQVTVPETANYKIRLFAVNGSKVGKTHINVIAPNAYLKGAKKVKRGKKMAFKGSNFAPNESVKLRISVDGSDFQANGKKQRNTTVTANPSGNFLAKVKMKKVATGRWVAYAIGKASTRTTTAVRFRVKK